MVSGDYSLQCSGFSLQWLLSLQSSGSRHMGFSSCSMCAQWVWHTGLSCSAACGIFPDQGSNPCLLHWQVDSHPLHHHGSPDPSFFNSTNLSPSLLCAGNALSTVDKALRNCLSSSWFISQEAEISACHVLSSFSIISSLW